MKKQKNNLPGLIKHHIAVAQNAYNKSKFACDPKIEAAEAKININQTKWHEEIMQFVELGLLKRVNTGHIYIQLHRSA